MGDTNAMLIKDNSNPYSPNKSTNPNTNLLIDFMQCQDLIAANTLFRKKSQFSFYGPNNRKVLLDYILVRRKWAKSVTNCDIRCVLSVASDHNLVKARIKWTLKNNKQVKPRNIKDLKLLKNDEYAKDISDYALKNCINDDYSTFKTLINDAIGQILPDKPKMYKA